jgi:5'-phosphate synthase pdxT subunit
VKIGVLALQGAIAEHIDSLKKCNVDAIPVKKVTQLDDLDGLVIPGGESTTVGKLMVKYGFDLAINEHINRGMAVFGTCTGLILLAKDIDGSEQPRLGVMNIKVKRNAYGRQVDSFQTDIEIPVLGDKRFPAVFIRAPYIESVSGNTTVLSELDGKVVFAQEGKLLAAAFHPELTDDLRVHRYFLSII